ncbi:MAG: DUF4912 domain-containing protein [Synechococcaceae cyanobacterium]
MASTRSSAPSLFTKTVDQLRELARSLGGRSDARPANDERVALLTQDQPEANTQETPAGAAAPMAACEGRTQVTFLPRDPQWAYVFWTISSADRQRAADAGAQQLCLRVADVTGLPLGAAHPHTLQELVVQANASEWYLPVPLCDREYRVELGYRLGRGGSLPLAVSSVARVPADGPSAVVADAFVPFSLEGVIGAISEPVGGGGVEHDRVYQLASGGSLRSRRIGSEVLHEHDFNQDQAGLLNASGAGLWASGRSESGSGYVRQRSFWLVADAELIVYGATEPSASLFIGDQQVPLEADGTFRVQVPFRDGEQLYPIRAVAADGEQQRSIRMDFQRRTPEARVNSREEAQLAWF